MAAFVLDPFYENIRAPMWVNFSNPDEVEGDSWFDTLSDTDDADRVRLMPTEFEIAQLLPDQVFDANTPEKPRSPTTLRPPVSAPIAAPVFSDDEEDHAEADAEADAEAEEIESKEAGETKDLTEEATCEEEDVEMTQAPASAAEVEAEAADTSIENDNVEETAESSNDEKQDEAPLESDTPAEVTRPLSLPPSPQMPKESAVPMEEAEPETAPEAEDTIMDDASAPQDITEEAPVANEAAVEEAAMEEVVESANEDSDRVTEAVEEVAMSAPVEEIGQTEPEATLKGSIVEAQNDQGPVVEMGDAAQEATEPLEVIEEAPEPSVELSEQPTDDEEPKQPQMPEEPEQHDDTEEVQEPEVIAQAAEGDALAPTESSVEEAQTMDASYTPTRSLVVSDLVKPADISTPPGEEAELVDASTSIDSGLDLSAIVEEGEEEEDFLVHDEDAVMAEIDSKEAAMMEEIAQKRKALEEKKAQAELLEVKMTTTEPHAGLRTPTLQEAFQRHRKKAKKSVQQMTLTEPQEFSFSTDARAAARQPVRRRSYSSASDSEASRQRAWTGHITEPQEFHFRTEERIQLRRSMRQSDIAEALKEPATPSRREWTGELTEPKEFNFSTDERMQLRSMNKAPLVSSDEKELKECRDFKAYPLNRKVLESAGDLGVPRLAKRKITRPHSPALATRDRSVLRKRLRGEVDDEEADGSGFDSGTDCQFDFAARFGRESDQANKLRRLSLTEPKPFSFQTEQRAAMRQSIRPSRAGEPTTPRTCYSSDCESSMANSAQRRASAKRSKRRKRATVRTEPLKLTEPKPFSFATDERALLKTPTKKRRMVEATEDSYEEAEAAKKVFSSFDRFAQEPRVREQRSSNTKRKRRRSQSLEPRKLTEPQPFRFQTEQRAQQQAVVSKPRDAGSENTGNLFAPLSSVNKTTGNKRTRGEHDAAPVKKKALRKVSDAKLNSTSGGLQGKGRAGKATKKREYTSRLMKPTAASTASSAASKAIQKKPRTHGMKTRSSRRKLTAPQSPMLQTRLRAAAIHGMRDL